jgi:hypothetical protein
MMYCQNEIPVFGAFITGGKDKYFLMSSKAHCCPAPPPPSKIGFIIQTEYQSK